MPKYINWPINMGRNSKLLLNKLLAKFECFNCFKILNCSFVMHNIMTSHKLYLLSINYYFEFIFLFFWCFFKPSFKKNDLSQIEFISLIIKESISYRYKELSCVLIINLIIGFNPTSILMRMMDNMNLILKWKTASKVYHEQY